MRAGGARPGRQSPAARDVRPVDLWGSPGSGGGSPARPCYTRCLPPGCGVLTMGPDGRPANCGQAFAPLCRGEPPAGPPSAIALACKRRDGAAPFSYNATFDRRAGGRRDGPVRELHAHQRTRGRPRRGFHFLPGVRAPTVLLRTLEVRAGAGSAFPSAASPIRTFPAPTGRGLTCTGARAWMGPMWTPRAGAGEGLGAQLCRTRSGGPEGGDHIGDHLAEGGPAFLAGARDRLPVVLLQRAAWERTSFGESGSTPRGAG